MKPGFVTVEAYAKREGTNPEQVISDIREGRLVGQVKDGQWYVSTGTPITGGGQTMQASAAPRPVYVTDIHMPFSSMVGFMVKWAIASIPALIILIVLFTLLTGFIAGLTAGY